MTGSPALLPASPSTADVCFPTHFSAPSSHSASLHSLSFEFGESSPETSPDTGMSMVQSPSAALSLALPLPNPHSYTFDKPPFRSFGIQSPVAWPADGFGGIEHDARFVPDQFAMRLSHVDAYPAGPFRDVDGAEEMLTMPNAPVGLKMEASEHPMDFTLENMPSPFSEDRSSPSSSAHASVLGNVSPVSDKRRRLGSPTGSASTASSKVAHRSSDSKRRSGGGTKRKQSKKGASPPLPTSGADVPAETDPLNGEAQASEATSLPAQPAQPAAVGPSLATEKQPEEAKLAPAKSSKKREPPSASQITESGQPFPVIDTSATHSSLFVHPDTSGLTKREARLVKNRAAAFLSRQRKREQFEELESRCRSMSRLVWRLWEVAAGPDMPWSAFGQTVLPMLLGEETPDVREVLELVVNAKGASIAPTEDPSAGSSVPPLSDQASESSESFSTRGVKRDREEADHTANAATSDQAPQNELFSLRSQMEASNLNEAASASQWPASMNMLNEGSAAPRPQSGGSSAQAGDERPFRSGPPASNVDRKTKRH
ncbi:Basic-leucine zipper domain [Ceraceosorus bombacis]|uniref:Basic-leucine zipper domain n=1 Tax=Ceraceosorus bombacis TaxID=401625 RepID=A0A0P1B7Z6_9BASI|nr:Basic-leucine zipper domain [Ceraceosorus bombacis]